MGLFELFVSYGILGLFLTGLISSIIPIPTEPVVFTLLDIGKKPEIILITLVIGSILGAFLGYLVGIYGLRKIVRFHSMQKERQVQLHFRKYGTLYLLVSPWIPLVGDLAPMIAGRENYDLKKFLIVISAAKTIKSIGIVYLSIKAIEWWTVFVK
ncbi:MAG: VTT domain-containing protein [Candidatus Methanoperedens sp.]|nr:VTT domain-containing protein [Candidatus Methanoperedens sp.]